MSTVAQIIILLVVGPVAVSVIGAMLTCAMDLARASWIACGLLGALATGSRPWPGWNNVRVALETVGLRCARAAP